MDVSRKKILILGTSLQGGVTTYVARVINEIADFDFVVPIGQEISPDKLNKVFPNASFVSFNQNYTWFNIFLSLSILKQIIKNHRIEIIHSHTLRSGAISALYKFFFNPNIKLIYTGHGLRYTQKVGFMKTSIFKWIEKVTNLISDKVIFIRRIDQRQALEDNLANPNKIALITTQLPENDVNNNKSISLKSKFRINTPYVIANAASIYDIKNPDLFIEIAQLVLKKRTDVTFVWFGEGTAREIINNKLVELQLSKHIKFVGSVDQDQMFYLFQEVNALLLTSKIEVFPLVLIEAYMTHTLVFSSNFKGHQEIIKINETGFVFDMLDPNNASEMILKELFDPVCFTQTTQKAYSYFKDNLSDTKSFIEAHRKIYNEIK